MTVIYNFQFPLLREDFSVLYWRGAYTYLLYMLCNWELKLTNIVYSLSLHNLSKRLLKISS